MCSVRKMLFIIFTLLSGSHLVLGRICVQCNSESDEGCKTRTQGMPCTGGKQYCSTVYTTPLLPLNTVETSIIRSCTYAFSAVDECKITNVHPGSGPSGGKYIYLKCYSTCYTDNCNINIPNGFIDGKEKKPLKCVRCNSTVGDCGTGGMASLCPAESTHCKATVTYVISDSNEDADETTAPASYRLLSVVRECSSAPEVTGCEELHLLPGINVKQVTCQETCIKDGCNTGWPARPKCLKSPNDDAGDCLKPYHKYCYVKERRLESETEEPLERLAKSSFPEDGFLRRISRGCSYANFDSGCSSETVRDKKIQNCNYTCTTDGCNIGGGGKQDRADAIVIFTLLVSSLSFSR